MKMKRLASIPAMNGIDPSELDGRLLQLLVAVVEEQSVTRAALRLDVTQSAVSHMLDKLRAIVGDALVVKSGRGIVPTARAQTLAREARRLLDELRRFATAGDFDPARAAVELTIAANDLQCDLLLPALLARLQARAPGLRLRVIPSGAPRAELLRDALCELIVTPRPPDAPDLKQRRLFEDRYVVFYDATRRAAPADRADYLAARHVTVLYEPQRQLGIDRHLESLGVVRRIDVRVPAFAGIAAFLRGSDRLASLPARLGDTVLAGLATAALPFEAAPMPMYMVWHLRHDEDPLQRWLRDELVAVAAPLAG